MKEDQFPLFKKFFLRKKEYGKWYFAKKNKTMMSPFPLVSHTVFKRLGYTSEDNIHIRGLEYQYSKSVQNNELQPQRDPKSSPSDFA